MKKFTKVALIGVAATTLFAFSAPTGDSPFEGVVTFSMSFTSSDPSTSQMAAMMNQSGSSTKNYIKGDKVRTEVMAGMMHRIVIADRKTKETVTLVDMMGNKYEIKSDPNKPKTTPENTPEIKLIDSTKTIAGYLCHAALVTVTSPKTGDKNTVTVYYTDQLPYSEDMGQFKGLKGFPMQFSSMMRGMRVNLSVQTVEKKALSDTLFVIPAKGYKVVASEQEMMKDIQQDAGGGGGN